MVDLKSVVLCSITFVTGAISQITLGSAVAIVSLMVGLSTLLYNAIKIYKEIKSK